MHRRTLLRTATAAVLSTAATRPAAATQAGPSGTTVALETVAEGLTSPVGFAAGDGRRFVADQIGVLYVDEGDGLRETLDLRDRVVDLDDGYDERGLLGVTLHPEFGANGRLFVRYSAPPRPGTPDSYDHTFVLSEFVADGGTVDPDAERTILEIPQPQANHNAGDLKFGPDGYLYVPVGDGGGANDRGQGHVSDWYEANEGGNGQDVTENLLGSILRIDVDESESVDDQDGERAYAVPEDNPLVGREGLDEQYAWGFRNPWRTSFDGEAFYVADVGQDQYEEVNLVEKGGNYGWNVTEGTHCFGADDCPEETPDGDPLVDPIVEYSHSGDGPTGVSVVGGHVYRGDALPSLRGAYIFADWRAAGRLFAATPADDGLWPITEIPVDPAEKLRRVLAFGRQDGESFVLTTRQSGLTGDTGAVHRIVPADGAEGSGTSTANATRSTAGTGAEDATATRADGAPGFGALAGLLGGAAGYALFRRDR